MKRTSATFINVRRVVATACLGTGLLVILATFLGRQNPVVSSSLQSRDAQAQNSIEQPVLSATTLPDIENIPVYPGAVQVSANNRSYKERHLSYEAPANTDIVTTFYSEALSKSGWQEHARYSEAVDYVWTDNVAPWHLKLHLSILPSFTGSSVSLDFGRFPDAGDNLLKYPNAQQVTTVHDQVTEIAKSGDTRLVQVTQMSYLTPATPADVDSFYRSSSETSGWMLVEPSTDNSPRKDSLHLAAIAPGNTGETITLLDLYVKIDTGQDGLTQVMLTSEARQMSSRF